MGDSNKYVIAGSIKCNNLVEDAKDMVSFTLQLNAEGGFNISKVEAMNILGKMSLAVMQAVIGK